MIMNSVGKNILIIHVVVSTVIFVINHKYNKKSDRRE